MPQDEVLILIKAEDQASQVLRNVQNNARTTAQGIEQSSQAAKRSFESIREPLNKVSNALLGVGAAGMGLAGVATAVGMEFNKNLYATAAVAGAFGDQLKELEGIAKQVGQTTIVSASDAAEAMYYLASAGFNTQQIMDSLNGVVNLSAATFTDVATASALVVNTLAQFQLGADQAARVADVLTKATTLSQATIEKLSYSLSYAGPVAQAFGISLEETVAVLSAFYDAGLRGEQAGTAFRNILLSLVDPGKEAATVIQSLGMTVEDINPLKHSLTEIAQKFKEAGITADQLAAVVGREAVAAFQTLIESGTKINRLTQELENAAGTAQKLGKEIEESAYGKMQKLKNQLELLAINVLPAVVDAFQTLLQPVMTVVNWFNSLDETSKKVIATVLTWGSAGALFIGTAGKMVVLINDLIKAFKALMAIDYAKFFSGLIAKMQAAGTAALTLTGILKGLATAGVGALVAFNVYEGIKLGGALVELSKVKRETAQTEEEGKRIEAFNELVRALAEIARTNRRFAPAVEELSKKIGGAIELGGARTAYEAGLYLLATEQTGALGELLKQYPEVRRRAESYVREYRIRVTLDAGEFQREWQQLRTKIEREILNEVYEGSGIR